MQETFVQDKTFDRNDFTQTPLIKNVGILQLIYQNV